MMTDLCSDFDLIVASPIDPVSLPWLDNSGLGLEEGDPHFDSILNFDRFIDCDPAASVTLDNADRYPSLLQTSSGVADDYRSCYNGFDFSTFATIYEHGTGLVCTPMTPFPYPPTPQIRTGTPLESLKLALSSPSASSPTSGADEQLQNKADMKKQKLPHHRENRRVKRPSSLEHNRKVEKKYRKKLASNLEQLRASVPGLQAYDETNVAEAELFGFSITRKRSKATTIAKACEFIEHMKKEYTLMSARKRKAESEAIDLRKEIARLRGRTVYV